jgi:hypothetical protein
MKKYYIVKEKRNIIHTINRSKANLIGYILHRNCPLRHVTEGKIDEMIQVSGRRGRRRKQALDELKGKRGYWKLKRKH